MSIYRKKRTANVGFSLVELTIVIIVLAILASIVVVGYNVLTQRAIEASMRSDLETARVEIAGLKGAKKNYPDTASAANNGQGLKASNGNTIQYGGSGTDYCVSVKNSKTKKTFQLYSKTNGKIEEGNCGGFVETLAGASSYSNVVDGTGTAATFAYPTSIAKDSAGNLYVTDCGSSIRKITPAGVVTTFSGSKTIYAYADGAAADARFQCPNGLFVNGAGEVFVTENSGRIRKVSPTGTATTLAGSGVSGFADGTGTAAQFRWPMGIVVDTSGNIFVADSGNHRIRKIDTSNVVTTFAGSGSPGFADATGAAAQFWQPWGLGIDAANNLYVGDYSNHRIRKITPSGQVTTLAGSGVAGDVDATGAAAQFNRPGAISVDSSGNVFVYDVSNYHIRKVTPSGVVTTIAGKGPYSYTVTDTAGLLMRLGGNYNGLLIDSATGVIYYTDSDNYLIRKLNP